MRAETPIKRALSIRDIPNAFKATPLDDRDMAEFYEDTMLVRTGQAGESPIKDIYEGCCELQERNAYLLMGHMGCGKSTELNRLAKRLRDEGYPVRVVYCSAELDRANMEYTDVLILMADALLSLAEETGRTPDKSDLEKIRTFWNVRTERERIEDKSEQIQAEAGVGGALRGLLEVFFSIKSSLKYDVEKRTVYREQIVRRGSDWLGAINRVADCLSTPDGKRPILIFEDLDKGDTWNIFHGHCEMLTGMSFPVVYTFPIAYYYEPAFNDLSAFFSETCNLPMIKTRTIEGEPFEEGRAALRAIIERRTDPSLFEDGVIDSLIDRTGGCLRHLFQAITKSAVLAKRLSKPKITMELADRALMEIKSNLSARVEGKEHDFLVEIARGKHKKIENKPMLLHMMQALAVLEYNGERWYNVHPLMEEYLREIKMLPPKQQ
ncbi:MAG: hypothetical protein K6G54_08425 [Oscillospiraceae bacterium]|nr:hypothetical protein [Oscillospiraceae bacterium]